MITAKYTLTIRGQTFELTGEEAEALRIHATHTIQPIRNCSANQELTPDQFRKRFVDYQPEKELMKPLPDTHVIQKSISGF